jgi:hypothetical protein
LVGYTEGVPFSHQVEPGAGLGNQLLYGGLGLGDLADGAHTGAGRVGQAGDLVGGQIDLGGDAL